MARMLAFGSMISSIQMEKEQIKRKLKDDLDLNRRLAGEYFDLLSNRYDHFDIHNHPEMLYSMDFKMHKLCYAHCMQMGVAAATIDVTIISCFNAAGTAIPPMVVFQGLCKYVGQPEDMPEGSLIMAASDNTMNQSLFFEFLKHLTRHRTPGKCMLIVDMPSLYIDNHVLEVTEVMDINLFCLPPKEHELLQPNKEAFHGPLNDFWIMQECSEIPSFKYFWSKCVSSEKIVKAFRDAGLFPFDKEVLLERSFGPSDPIIVVD